jgi:hypothetical protein
MKAHAHGCEPGPDKGDHRHAMRRVGEALVGRYAESGR